MGKITILLALWIALTGAGCSRQGAERTATEREGTDASRRDTRELAMVEGKLLRVDDDKDLIWIETADGKEMQFHYSFGTDVEGADETVEGLFDGGDKLAGKGGTQLRIHYRPGPAPDSVGPDEASTAIKIEVLDRSAGQTK